MSRLFAQSCHSGKERPLRFQDNCQTASDKVGLAPVPEVWKRSR